MKKKQPFSYTAEELYSWIAAKPDFVLLDVRNEKEFANWFVEGPNFFPYINIPYFFFMDEVEKQVSAVPAGEKIRIVCAKEGSAKYVAELLTGNGFDDVGYLEGGIISWGNMLAASRVSPADAGYELFQIVRPGKASCSYLLVFDKEAFVVDPSRNVDFYMDFAQKSGAKIIKIFETHRQADYISGSTLLSEKTGAPIMVKDEDFKGAGFKHETIADGQVFTFAAKKGPKIKALHTPGHTMGSTSYLIDGKYLLSGDTVFINTAGRPDLGGKSEQWSRFLYLTLTVKLRDITDNVLVLPGHFSSWEEANREGLIAASLGTLRKNNIAFRLPNEQKFSEFIKANLRPQPGIYLKIRRINGGWLQVEEDEANTMDLGKNECAASNYGRVGVSAQENITAN